MGSARLLLVLVLLFYTSTSSSESDCRSIDSRRGVATSTTSLVQFLLQSLEGMYINPQPPLLGLEPSCPIINVASRCIL